MAVTLNWSQLNAISTTLGAACDVLESTAGRYTRAFQELNETRVLIASAADELAKRGAGRDTT